MQFVEELHGVARGKACFIGMNVIRAHQRVVYRGVIGRLAAEKLQHARHAHHVGLRKQAQDLLPQHIVGVRGAKTKTKSSKGRIGAVKSRGHALKYGSGIINHRAFITGKTKPLIFLEWTAQVKAKLFGVKGNLAAVFAFQNGRRIEERVFTKQEGARTRRETWPRRKAVGIRAEAAALGAGHVIVISLRRKAGKRRSQGTGIGGRLVKRRAVVYRERAVGIELVGVEVAECAAMEGIVAALGHHVDGAAGVASVLCIGGAGDNAELLHRVIHLKRHCLIAARSHVVGPIQQEAVARGPVSRDAERGPGQTRSLLHVVRIGWNQPQS